MNLIPGLRLRSTLEEEEMGLDDGQLGEFAYDFVEVRRNVDELLGGEVEGPSSSRESLKGATKSDKKDSAEKTA